MKAVEAQELILEGYPLKQQLEIINMINAAMDAQADYIIYNGKKKYVTERDAWRNLKADTK